MTVGHFFLACLNHCRAHRCHEETALTDIFRFQALSLEHKAGNWYMKSSFPLFVAQSLEKQRLRILTTELSASWSDGLFYRYTIYILFKDRELTWRANKIYIMKTVKANNNPSCPPIISINYFAALQQADAGIIQPFIDYIAVNLARSLEIMIAGAKGESIEEPDDIDKELRLLEERVKNIGGKFATNKQKKHY